MVLCADLKAYTSMEYIFKNVSSSTTHKKTLKL